MNVRSFGGIQHYVTYTAMVLFSIAQRLTQKPQNPQGSGHAWRRREIISPKTCPNHPGIYPPEEVLRQSEFLIDLGDFTTNYEGVWTEVRQTE